MKRLPAFMSRVTGGLQEAGCRQHLGGGCGRPCATVLGSADRGRTAPRWLANSRASDTGASSHSSCKGWQTALVCVAACYASGGMQSGEIGLFGVRWLRAGQGVPRHRRTSHNDARTSSHAAGADAAMPHRSFRVGDGSTRYAQALRNQVRYFFPISGRSAIEYANTNREG